MKIMNFLLRMVYGTVGIKILNLLFAWMGISVSVGVNPVSVLSVGILGLNGLGLVFGIAAYGVL